jgi:hypothetical protein
MTTQPNHYYELYFKLVYTCQTKNYIVNPNISIKDFIKNVKARARNDFNLNNDEDVEIVEAGNPDNINGHDAELAPALEPSSTTIREIYGNRHTRTAFYIRKIPLNIVIDIPEEENQQENNYSNQQYNGEENV